MLLQVDDSAWLPVLRTLFPPLHDLRVSLSPFFIHQDAYSLLRLIYLLEGLVTSKKQSLCRLSSLLISRSSLSQLLRQRPLTILELSQWSSLQRYLAGRTLPMSRVFLDRQSYFSSGAESQSSAPSQKNSQGWPKETSNTRLAWSGWHQTTNSSWVGLVTPKMREGHSLRSAGRGRTKATTGA